MVKRILALLLALVLAAGSGLAELKLRDTTPAQKMLVTYMANVNRFLLMNGEQEINKIFDQQNSLVEMGITMTDDAFIPEHVTVTVHLRYEKLYYMVLRVDDVTRFPQIAGAFLQALNPETMTQEESLKTPAERAQKAAKNPSTSFEDYEYDRYEDMESQILNGVRPQTYYAYYPDQYHDGVNWIQLMIIFPLPDYWDAEQGVITETGEEAPEQYFDDDGDEMADWYFPEDAYTHIETFATATPEPDSAAAESEDWYRK